MNLWFLVVLLAYAVLPAPLYAQDCQINVYDSTGLPAVRSAVSWWNLRLPSFAALKYAQDMASANIVISKEDNLPSAACATTFSLPHGKFLISIASGRSACNTSQFSQSWFLTHEFGHALGIDGHGGLGGKGLMDEAPAEESLRLGLPVLEQGMLEKVVEHVKSFCHP